MIKGRLGFSTLPAAIVLGCVVCSVLIQSVLFGANFVFRDGTGGEKREYEVTNNEILANVKTTKENALNLQGLNDYLLTKEMEKAEVLLYGDVPALSFYFSLKPVLSSTWPDLESFSYEKFAEEMDLLYKNNQFPMVIINVATKESLGNVKALEENTNREKKIIKLKEFLENNQYEERYSNEAFVVYEIVEN